MNCNWKIYLGITVLFALLIVIIFIDDILVKPVCYNSYSVQKPRWISNNNQTNDLKTNHLNSIKTSITDKSLYSPGHLKPPAVYLALKGGLGNQLFQYACHYALARKNNWPLYTFVSFKVSQSLRKFEPKGREFALDYFTIPLFDWNTVDEQWGGNKDIMSRTDGDILSGNYPNDRIISLSGGDYCQSEIFFGAYKQEILKLYTQTVQTDQDAVFQEWVNLIKSDEESVAVHIRRGDFIRINVSVPISYYKQSMQRMETILKKPPTFYIFTDDVDFAEKEFNNFNTTNHNNNLTDSNLNEIVIVSIMKFSSIHEFYLMSLCSHDIIPNSSFGWWAAYLNPNPNKVVIAAHQNLKLYDQMYPKKEMQGRKDFFKFEFRHMYFPIDWIQVDPFN